MYELIGLTGGALLALCGLPQAFKSYQDGHSDGISYLFIFSWFLGEVLCLYYILPFNSLPLYFNYGSNLLIAGVILWYRLRPRR